MMKRFGVLCACLLLFTACQEKDASAQAQQAYLKETIAIVGADGEQHEFNVDLALSQPQIIQGLMHRTYMPEKAGMLFVFGDEAERAFWMKNTLIPLDMLFIKGDGRIHHIHENAKPQDLTSISSNGPVKAVLEINGGLAEKLGLQPGDRVHSSFFKNKLAE